MSKSYHKERTACWYTVMSLQLKPIKQCLIDITSFRLSKSLYSHSILFKRTDNFPNCLDHRIYETKFLTHVKFLFVDSLFVISL